MFNNLRSPRKVVISGFGCVTPIGVGKTEYWSGLRNGRSGVSKIESFDVSESSVQIAAEVKNRKFTPAWGPTKKDAEQRAAGNALAELKDEPPPYGEE